MKTKFVVRLCGVFVFLLALSSGESFAQCSSHLGKVVFNEIHDPSSGTAFLEIKVLDPSVLTATGNFSGWKIDAYKNNASTKAAVDVSSAFSNGTVNTCGQVSAWIRIPDNDLGSYINGSNGVNNLNFVMYESASKKIIDVLRFGSASSFYGAGSNYLSCPTIESALPSGKYDAAWGINGNKDWYRTPDGTGAWGGLQTGNNANTGCASNDGGAGTFSPSKIPAVTTIAANTNFNYTLYATNGITAVTTPASVVITDNLTAAGLTFVSCTASPGTTSGTSAGPTGTCTHSAGVVTWTVGAMAANKQYLVTLTVKAASAGSKVNQIVDNVSGLTTSANAVTVTGPPALTIASASLAEGNSGTSNMTFTITQSASSVSNTTVAYATTPGTATAGASCTSGVDYVTTSGTATIAAGSTTTTFNVPICGDTVYEPNETFTVTLSSPTNATIGTATATGTINDDDAMPTLSIGSLSMVEGNSGTSNMTFTITQSAASGYTTTVNYATSNGTATGGTCGTPGVDFGTTSGVATIAAGTTTATVVVPICGDVTYEGDESFTVTLSGPANATLATITATGTITNDDMPPLFAEYRLDGGPWSGVAKEVKDTSGNGFDAVALGISSNFPKPLSATPALSGASGTCGYASFGGASSGNGISVGTVDLGLGGAIGESVAAWVRWGISPSAGSQWATIATNGASNTGQFMLQHNQTNTRFEFAARAGASRTYVWSKTAPVSGQWYHVVGVYDGAGVHLYVNGVLDDLSSASLSGTVTAYSPSFKFNIGMDNLGGRLFQGDIDEVKVFGGSLNAAQVAALYSERHACVVGPDHYELSLPTSSINCLPTTVTVTACANNSSPCTSAYTAASGATATLGTGGATLGATSITFNASGVATTTLSYPSATDGTAVSVSLSGESMAATNGRQCCANGTACSVANSCSSTFNTAGFIVTNSAGGASFNIPTQTAGTTSGTIYLRAVQTTTANAACSVALTGTTSVNMAYQCNNPTTCYGTNLMSINGGTATTIQGHPNVPPVPPVSSYTAVPMTFDAAGNAPFTLNYSDVGLTTLWFSKVVNSATLTGSSNAFVTKPAGFLIAGVKQTAAPQLANPGSVIATTPGATDTKFVKAGEVFSATVSAVTSGGAATPNYGRETPPEGVLLSHTLVAPSGGNNGTLSNGTIAGGSFASGVATVTNLAWDEVGFISLNARVADNDYLGVGNITSTHGFNVGRFIPDHFAITAGTVAPACSNAFTYFGQDFVVSPTSNAFATPFTLTAQNLANGTTQNYTDSFAKLSLTAWGAAPASAVAPGYGFSAATLPAGSVLSASTTAPTGSWPSLAAAQPSRGVASITAKHKVSRPTALAGVTGLTVSAAPVDADGVTVAATAVAAASNFYYGRLQMQNAYGSEMLPLPLPLVAQYWNGSGWVVNTLDNCTSLPLATAIGLAFGAGNLSLGETTPSINGATSGSGLLIAGNANFRLTAPGAGNNGYLTITITTPTWLKYPWVSAGVDADASARATFGIFKSPLIYRRENY